MDSSANTADVVEFDPSEGTYRTRYESNDDRPSMALIEAIAAVRDLNPSTMDPLGRSIDMGALDRTLQSSGGDVSVQVSLQPYELQVTIDSRGVIELTPTDSDQ